MSNSAFPVTFEGGVNNNESPYFDPGMTLRDYFAAQALAGMLSNCDESGDNGWSGIEAHAAATAYGFADAMLEARK